MFRRGDPTLLACAVLAVGAVGVALVLQHAFDMRPCAWCTFQRLLFLLVAVLALAGWALGRVRGAAAACAALAGLVAVGGVWAALHQQFVAAQAQSCAFTLADRVLMNPRLDEFLAHFESWPFGWLDVPGLIRGARACFEYPMVDRDPLPSWGSGRVTLLGDAAHPMYPIGSNGASQAILDARVLTREIRAHGLGPAALAAYAAERNPATARIVLANRANGPEQVMQLVEERAPQGYARIEDVLSLTELENAAAGYKRLAGFDRETLNSRPPIVAAG